MTASPSRLRRWLASLALLLILPAASAVAQDFELPPVDEVFVLSAQATAPDRIEVRWQIAEGYYLYRHRTSIKADAGFSNAKLALPTGDKHHDEFFGDVETYRQQLTGTLSGTPAAGATSTTLTVKYQGCADAGVCYPPQTRTLKVALPAAGGDAGFGFAKKAGGLFGFGNADTGATDAAPLPVEQAFTTEVISDGGNTLLLRLTPARGYYIYRDKLSIKLDAGKGLSATLPPASKLPKAQPYRDEHFGNVAVYFGQVEIAVPVTRTVTTAAKGTLLLGLQGCQTDGICYPPMTRKLAVSLPAGTITPVAAVEPASAETIAATTNTTAATNVTSAETAPVTSDAAVISATSGIERTQPPQQQTRGLLASLLLALFGGLILNLMPCVLPVLSLKALSLAQSGESPQRARRHALAYTAGVIVSFAALGALALALRKAGLALGWGFQLQQPLVVAVLALVVFAFGLSLSGLWYANVGVGQRGGALMQRGGMSGDFFTGVLAVVLATPCTAPFMGAALAYAFTGPAAGGMLVFLMLGLGLALPFLLIGFVPAFARLLPKPGAWMETLKQLLAFPLYATAAWLVWVLAKQRGADAAGLWLAAAIALALGAWAWTRLRSGGGRGWLILVLAALVGIGWPLLKLHRLPKPDTAAIATNNGIASVAFSEQALADLRAQGRVVFVNMTADWCVSCKANEKTVFARDGFRDAMEAANAVYMVGDYTDVDPVITAYLQRHKAVGVPLYVVYPRGGGEGRILPVILTPGIADEALAQAAGGR
ncbi:protein-disulfide reductase DsbD [Thermomonas sp. HDW16]|uniref:protein-disulfide reductase DsbD family protein n=1 Tax=Thermomonas sp. HDW16 TaxID=2714945 RepID=UPI00140E308F|nr:protein-disulfide reductase DsbD [Thermomonas sp. HDW16]QIL19817.1 cytochrome C biogenesis protein [Thermomonas sp. HDW16]